MLSVNFGFEIEGEKGAIYARMIYEALKDKISDQRMSEDTLRLCKECSAEEWNKLYGFRGKPPLADWLNYFVPKIMRKVDEYYTCPISGATLVRHRFIEENTNQKLFENEK